MVISPARHDPFEFGKCCSFEIYDLSSMLSSCSSVVITDVKIFTIAFMGEFYTADWLITLDVHVRTIGK